MESCPNWRLVILLSSTIVACAVGTSDAAAPAIQNPRLLVIALDGLRGDGVSAIDAPNLQAIQQGTWAADYRAAYSLHAQTIKDAVTVSGPNHTSIFTGVTARKHGVIKNDDDQMRAVIHPDFIKLIEDRRQDIDSVKIAQWKPDHLVPTGADYSFNDKQDEQCAAVAAKILAGGYSANGWAAGRDVDVMFVFLDDIDGGGHGSRFAVDEPKYIATVRANDRRVGMMLDAIRSRPNFASEEWMIVLTSDHGGYLGRHGDWEADCYNIPFIVSSKATESGELVGVPGNVDTTATVLTHFGIDPKQSFQRADGQRYQLDSVARGFTAAEVAKPLPTELDVSMDRIAFDGQGKSAVVQRTSPTAAFSASFEMTAESQPTQTVELLSLEATDKTSVKFELVPGKPDKDGKVNLPDLVVRIDDARRPERPELMGDQQRMARPGPVAKHDRPIQIGRVPMAYRPGAKWTVLLAHQPSSADVPETTRLYVRDPEGRVISISDDTRDLGPILGGEVTIRTPSELVSPLSGRFVNQRLSLSQRSTSH